HSLSAADAGAHPPARGGPDPGHHRPVAVGRPAGCHAPGGLPVTQVFRLPDLGEGLTEATVIDWHVAEGDTVSIDQEAVTVETAKAAVEVPCPYAGVVTTLHPAPGEELAVGDPLITIAALADAETYRTEERAGATVPVEGNDAPDSGAEPATSAEAGGSTGS